VRSSHVPSNVTIVLTGVVVLVGTPFAFCAGRDRRPEHQRNDLDFEESGVTAFTP